MIKNRTLQILLIIAIINAASLFSGNCQETVLITSDKTCNYYRTLSLGLNNSLYRDFATSPLFYSGYGIQLQTSWLKQSSARERSFDIGFCINSMSAKIPESDFFQPTTTGIFGQLNMSYLQLWELKRFSDKKNNIKVGGVCQVSQNFRINTSLQNNAIGVENLTNLMASGQITRDISRKSLRKMDLGIFKKLLKPVTRDLRFRLNAGILNFNYRPGYAYAYNGAINGIETQSLSWILSNYKWSLNGWRFNTVLEYVKYLPNGNAKSWSYVWDAANAPGRFEKFQMAAHQIRYTYYFQTKTK